MIPHIGSRKVVKDLPPIRPVAILRLNKKGDVMGTIKLLIFSFIATTLSACMASYHAPQVRKLENSRIYSASFDSTWQKLVYWFTLHNTPIKTIDRSSGLIATDYNLAMATYQSYCDCGTTGVGIVSKRIESPVGNFNVVLKHIDGKRVEVKVSAFFRATLLTVNDASRQPIASESLDCMSTGKIEKDMLDFLAQ
jgi:hypothetical protein